MTDLGGAGYQNTNARRTRARRINTFVPSGVRDDEADTTWESIQYGLGIFSDFTTRLIGRTFTDDPKYSEGIASDFHSQQSIITGLHDAGIENSLLLIALGVPLEFANPLDPFNKMRLFSKTAKGELVDVVRRAGKANQLNKSGLLDMSSLRRKLSEFRKAERHATARGRLSGSDKFSVEEAKHLSAAQESVKTTQDAIRRRSEMNKLLKQFKARGGDMEAAVEKTSRFQQAMDGQRRLVGLSSPLTFDQIPGLGKRHPTLSAARSVWSLGLSDKGIPGFGTLNAIGVEMGLAPLTAAA